MNEKRNGEARFCFCREIGIVLVFLFAPVLAFCLKSADIWHCK